MRLCLARCHEEKDDQHDDFCDDCDGNHISGTGCNGPTEREVKDGGGREDDGAHLGDAQEPLHLLQRVEGGRPGRGDGDDLGDGDGDGDGGGDVVEYGEYRYQLSLGVKDIFSQVSLVKNSTVIVLKNSTDFNSLADLI